MPQYMHKCPPRLGGEMLMSAQRSCMEQACANPELGPATRQGDPEKSHDQAFLDDWIINKDYFNPFVLNELQYFVCRRCLQKFTATLPESLSSDCGSVFLTDILKGNLT
jgi:hypothetical protein